MADLENLQISPRISSNIVEDHQDKLHGLEDPPLLSAAVHMHVHATWWRHACQQKIVAEICFLFLNHGDEAKFEVEERSRNEDCWIILEVTDQRRGIWPCSGPQSHPHCFRFQNTLINYNFEEHDTILSTLVNLCHCPLYSISGNNTEYLIHPV